jgi:hypothetical protein
MNKFMQSASVNMVVALFISPKLSPYLKTANS